MNGRAAAEVAAPPPPSRAHSGERRCARRLRNLRRHIPFIAAEARFNKRRALYRERRRAASPRLPRAARLPEWVNERGF